MKKTSVLLLIVLILLCNACTPSVMPSTGSTEPSENSQPLPIGNENTIISNLLTEVNLTGKIQASDQLVPPGTLPAVSEIPSADQSVVGRSVTVNLASNQPEGSFLFRIDPQSNKGMLAVVLRADQLFYIPLLLILETELDGSDLCQALTSGADFTATVLSATNISFDEGMYTICNLNANQLNSSEIADLNTPPTTYPSSTQFLGRFGAKSAPLLYKHVADMSGISTQLYNQFQAFSKVFSRFSVNF